MDDVIPTLDVVVLHSMCATTNRLPVGEYPMVSKKYFFDVLIDLK